MLLSRCLWRGVASGAAAGACRAPWRPLACAAVHTPVRVRYAPSPTGNLHLGGLRTALYNYLFARKHGGSFVLRVEDTDLKRFVPDSLDSIGKSLKWAGLHYDEGPDTPDAPFGPYRQSERLPLYQRHAGELLASGRAYRCFCTVDDLQAMRSSKATMGTATFYDRRCLQLTDAEVQDRLRQGVPHTLRLLVPPGETLVEDAVRGSLTFNNNFIDDQVLLKTDGFPTYHLACVVDDHHMQISHVIRGEEWLPSTPKHILLYRAFGWQPPVHVHLPLLLNKDGTKLSKRHNAAAVGHYMKSGYLPEAVLNFVAYLGWTPGGTKEVLTLEEMEKLFDIDSIHKAGAIVDIMKLDWFNAQHIRKNITENESKFISRCMPFLLKDRDSTRYSSLFLRRVLGAIKDRVTHMEDITLASSPYFSAPNLHRKDILKSIGPECGPVLVNTLTALRNKFDEVDISRAWDAKVASDILGSEVGSLGVSKTKYYQLMRFVLTGDNTGAPLPEMAFVVGPQEIARRLTNAIDVLMAEETPNA